MLCFASWLLRVCVLLLFDVLFVGAKGAVFLDKRIFQFGFDSIPCRCDP